MSHPDKSWRSCSPCGLSAGPGESMIQNHTKGELIYEHKYDK